MLEILALAIWTVFVAYTTWYITSAKYNVPISIDEARLLWKIHKQSIRCNARKWREIRHASKIVGFECECGYRHIQKRPVVANPPTLQNEQRTYVSNKLRNPSKTTKLQRQ